MLTFADDEFKRGIQDEIGVKPAWSAESFPDVATGKLEEVAATAGFACPIHLRFTRSPN